MHLFVTLFDSQTINFSKPLRDTTLRWLVEFI